MDLEGTVALVTGGASGIGAACARALAARGARTLIADLQDELGQEVAKETGGVFVHVDVSDAESVIRAVDVAEEMGPLRALLNCAGIGWSARIIGRDGRYESSHPVEDMRRMLEVNVVGTFNCARIGATAISKVDPLADGERGSILNVGSVAAFDGQIGQVAYAASKGGVVAMTLPMARDLAVVGIRVNAIVPGLVDTPIYGTGEAADQLKARLEGDLLFPKRFGEPEELAAVAMELISNSYVNAAVVRVDAGIRMPPK